MPQTEGRRTYNTFVKGIITEATGINYPENATIDESNFVLNRNGSRQRRLGFDREAQGRNFGAKGDFTATTTAGLDDGAAGGYQIVAMQSYLWSNTGPSVQIDLTVVQYGSRLYFFNANSDVLSSYLVEFDNVIDPNGTVANQGWYDLAAHTTGIYTGSDFESYPCSFSQVKGSLVVVGKHIEPFYLKLYDDGTFEELAGGTSGDTKITSLTGTTITIEIRDFEGVVSTEGGVELAFDERPTTDPPDRSHEYNLKNQGWDRAVDNGDPGQNPLKDVDATGGGLENSYFTVASEYPSNADTIHPGFQYNNTRRIWKYTHWQDAADSTNTNVTGGNYILNAFTKDRDGITPEVAYLSSGTLGTEVEQHRPSTVAVFAGRVWYSGVDSKIVETAGTYDVTKGDPNHTKVFFCQTLATLDSIGRCYQRNNPTSEALNEILPTDGGVIDIAESGKIVKIVGTKSSLFVFGTEGVWEIAGQGDGTGFKADSYHVNKITNVGALGRDSVVEAEGLVFYWSLGGIYALTQNEVGQWTAQNISENTIQTLYVAINELSRKNAVGFYDHVSKKVKWLYNSATTILKDKDRWVFNAELVFDTLLTAFYKNSFTVSTWFPAAYSPIAGQRQALDDVTVVVNGHPVVTASGATVGFTTTVNDSRGNTVAKYLIASKSTNAQRISFAEYRDTDFVDWASTGTSVDFSSYMVTGYELFGDPSVAKQIKSLHMYFNKTEDGFTGSDGDLAFSRSSGCYVRARWDWSDSGNSGKWSDKFQAYRFNRFYVPSGNSDTFQNGLPVIHTKNTLRGSGNALSLYIESESGKDMFLLGWTLDAEGRSVS